MFFEVSEQEDFHLRAVARYVFVEGFSDSAAKGRWKGLEQGAQFGSEDAVGDGADELVNEATEGDEGCERVAARAGLEGLGSQAKLERKVIGAVGDLAGEAFEVGRGEGMSMAAVFEGIEVTGGCTGGTRAEL